MKNVYIIFTLAAVSLASCKKEEEDKTKTTVTVETDSTIYTKPKADTAAAAPLDTVAMREAWEKYAAVGEQHKMLAMEVGSYNDELTFWMEPGAEPMKYKTISETRMVLGGRFQETKYKGMVMDMPFEGISTIGYNNISKEFASTWIDNTATGMMILTGKYDDTTKAVTYIGEMPDPMAPGKMIKMRQVYTMVDKNTYKLESYDIRDGVKEFKSMEIVRKRK
jgi:hypothetical protein